MKIIASLELIGITQDGERIKITGTVGCPYPVIGGESVDEWACPVSLTPLHKKLRDQHGGGSLQALCLAQNLMFGLLRGFREKGGRLQYSDGTAFDFGAYIATSLNENT